MCATRKEESDKKRFSDNQFTDFAEIASQLTCVTVYGKLFRNSEFSAHLSGLTPPIDPQANLQLALIVGYSEKGRCISLKEPQIAVMPTPTGSANDCGWDPREYVYWKNHPKDWNTLHLQVSSKSLYSVLTTGAIGGKIIRATDVVSVFGACIAHVTGNTSTIDLGKTLQPYGFDTQHQVDTFSTFVIGSKDFGVPHYGFSLPKDALNWVTNTTQLGNLLSFIQNTAVPQQVITMV
jgi:hypothetical protein